jgi:adenylate cyclase
VVPYFTGSAFRQLHVTTSYLHDDGMKVGVIAVLSDISELTELRDAVKAMQRIQQLNNQLELRNKLLNETFGRFLSDEIVRQLLDTPDGLMLGGKKRALTIMMSDLRGFTAMSEQMEPQALIAMLNHYLGLMTEAIQKYNGTIIEFIGDGIMAIFGAPVPSETHAADAVAAAISMQAAMSRVNQWNARRDYPRLEMGIGLNTGEVIIGNVGSRKRMKYGIVGSEVNLAGRIESYTIGGQILISPSVKAAIPYPLTVEREMTVLPKGVGKEIVLSHITGIGGPYNLSISSHQDIPHPLDQVLPICFFLIQDKHTQDQVHFGGFIALGRGTAILKTEASLKVFDNLQINAGGKLLCKVLDNPDGNWFLQFTSIPSGFSAWVKSHLASE